MKTWQRMLRLVTAMLMVVGLAACNAEPPMESGAGATSSTKSSGMEDNGFYDPEGNYYTYFDEDGDHVWDGFRNEAGNVFRFFDEDGDGTADGYMDEEGNRFYYNGGEGTGNTAIQPVATTPAATTSGDATTREDDPRTTGGGGGSTTTTPVVPAVKKTYSGAYGSTLTYVNGQTLADFKKHCTDLEAQGYKQYFSNSIKGNEYVTYKKDGKYLHTYFTAYAGEIRTVKDEFSTANFATQAQTYTKVTDTAVVQLIHNYTDGSWGMGYLIVLEDGRFVVIDGSLKGDGTNANRLYNLMKMLNKRADGKIVIAAWLLTHDHPDHYSVFQDFAERFNTKVTLEQVLVNTQGENVGGYLPTSLSPDVKKFGSSVSVWQPQVGQAFYLANARFEILHTVYSMFPEDVTGNINNTSLVFRMTVNNQTVLWPADIEVPASDIVCRTFGDYLKSDILQMPHHGCESPASKEFYTLVDPTVMFWDTAQWNINKWSRKVEVNRYALNEMHVKEFHVADGKYKMLKLPYTPGHVIELDVPSAVSG